MELTKEQIQYIENRLENEGVKYWDIRIEMLDHIVTDVENQMQKSEKFNIAVQNSFIDLGWKNSFKQLMERKQIQYQKNYKTLFVKGFKYFFTSLKTMTTYALFIACTYYFSGSNSIIKTILFSFIIPFGFFVIYSFINYKKVFKSVVLLTSFNTISLLLSFFNMFMFFPELFLGIEKLSPIYLSAITIFLFPLFYVSVKIFYDHYTKTNRIYKKLIS